MEVIKLNSFACHGNKIHGKKMDELHHSYNIITRKQGNKPVEKSTTNKVV